MKQERARRTREQVLTAAAEEFAARGFAQTTLDAVVARTTMSKGALYGHFSSKEELARALTVYTTEAWTALLAGADHPTVPPLEALRRLTVGLTEQLRTDVRIRAGLRLVAELPPTAGEPELPLGRIPRRMGELAASAQATSDISPVYAPAVIAQLLLTTVLGMEALPGLGLDRELPSGIEELWQLLVAALTGGGPDAPQARGPAPVRAP